MRLFFFGLNAKLVIVLLVGIILVNEFLQVTKLVQVLSYDVKLEIFFLEQFMVISEE